MQFEVCSLRTAPPKCTYFSPPVRFTVPALNLEYGKFPPVPLDEFRDLEASGNNTYEIRLRITEAGKVVDEAGARFVLGDPAPQIRSVSPPGGEPGSLVRIIGLNFGKALPGSTVKFNGQEATVRSWSETAIEVEVPRGATSGDVMVLRSGVKSNGVAFQVGARGPQPVYFTAQHTLTSPLGKSKQQCLDYTLTIRKGADAVWSGVSEQASETNGLLSTTLAPGDYGFEIAYRYRRPAATGKVQGKFTVTPGGVEVIVDTETGAATVRPRSTTAVKPDHTKPDTPVTVPFSAGGTFSSIVLSRPLPAGGEEAAGSVPATGKLAFSGSVVALTRLGAGGRVIAPSVAASVGTTVTISMPQGEKRDETAEVNASGSCISDATLVTEAQNVRTEWTFRPIGFIVSHTEPFVRDGRPAYRVVEASGDSIALRLTPGTSASLIRVFAVEAKRRSGTSESTEKYRGRVLIGTVRITAPGG